MGGKDNQDGFEGFDGGFDYGAFEEELVDDPPTDPDGGAPEEEPEAEVRKTFDRRSVPKGDATFAARSLGPFTLIAIRGRMNESFPADDIQAEIKGATVVDLRDVDRVSSFGVRGWLQVLTRSKDKPLYLSHCSDAIVNQITMMRNFCGHARIHSFLAPYACDGCGADFSVLYHSIDDRERIETRRPVDVACPECGEATEMDEDPFTYFDLSEHLLDEPVPELERAIAEMEGGERKNPIEIELEGERTCIRFNEALTSATRFKRVFNNVEGSLTVDLRSSPSTDEDAAEALVAALARLDAAISDVHVEGCPDIITQRLVERGLDRIQVRSVMTPVVDLLSGRSREALIDLDLHGRELAQGKSLSLPLSWAKGQVRPVNEALVARVLMGPAQQSLTAPPAPDVARPVPEPPPPPPVPTTSSASMLMPMAMAGGMLAVGLIAVGVFLMRPTVEVPVPTPVPVAAPEVAVWSTGGALPPAWAENPLQIDEQQILVAGRGSGPTPDDAASRARRAAEIAIAEQMIGDLEKTPGGPGLPAIDDADAEALSAAMSNLGLLRKEQAVQQLEDTVNVVARYSLERGRYDEVIEQLSVTGEFAGLTIGPMPPWKQPGLRLVALKSPNEKAEPGDRVLNVAGEQEADLAAFVARAGKAYADLAPGTSMTIEVDHQGTIVPFTFRKPELTEPDLDGGGGE